MYREPNQVSVFDRDTQTTETIPIAPPGFVSAGVSLADDGRYVTYGVTFVGSPPFIASVIHDLQTGTNETIVGTLPGVIAGDARYFSYNQLVPITSDTFRWRVFVFDRDTDTSELVSVTSSETELVDVDAFAGHLSDDGRFVLFSGLGDFVSDDTNQSFDTYVRDRYAGNTFLAVRSGAGSIADLGSSELRRHLRRRPTHRLRRAARLVEPRSRRHERRRGRLRALVPSAGPSHGCPGERGSRHDNVDHHRRRVPSFVLSSGDHRHRHVGRICDVDLGPRAGCGYHRCTRCASRHTLGPGEHPGHRRTARSRWRLPLPDDRLIEVRLHLLIEPKRGCHTVGKVLAGQIEASGGIDAHRRSHPSSSDRGGLSRYWQRWGFSPCQHRLPPASRRLAPASSSRCCRARPIR